MLVNTDFEGHGDIDKLVTAYAESSIASSLTDQIKSERNPASFVKSSSFLTTKMKLRYQPTDASLHREHQPSPWRQFQVLLHRAILNNARNPGIFWVRLVMYTMIAIMAGTLFLPSSSRTYTDTDTTVLLFGMFNFFVFLSVAVLPFFIEDRGVFLRERAISSLHIGSYMIANYVAALPGIFVIALVGSVVVVFLADLNSFGMFLLILFLSMVVAESLMRVIGSLVSNAIVAIAAGASVYGMFMLCQGFMVPPPAIPSYWTWGYYLAFHTYAFESFMFNQFLPQGHVLPGGPMPAALIRLGMKDVQIGRNMVILAGYSLGLELIFAAILFRLLPAGRR